MMPPWLSQLLEARGLANNDGFNRAARATVCRRCGATVMAGLDADTGAFPARCDPTPLNAQGELAALLDGHRTYSLTRSMGHYELDFRDAIRIRGEPPDSKARFDVLRAHICQKEIKDADSSPSTFTDPRGTATNDNCPF